MIQNELFFFSKVPEFHTIWWVVKRVSFYSETLVGMDWGPGPGAHCDPYRTKMEFTKR